MGSRKLKLEGDKDSDLSSLSGSPLKPKTEKAKVTKPKAEKATKLKADKVKVEKVRKALVAADGEAATAAAKPKKEPAVKKEVIKKDAPGKYKEKAVTVNGEEAMVLIKQYLKETNRPYSATEVSANLHGKVTKTVADKFLKELAESGQIMSKATKGNEKGSQWVFWAIQDASDNASPAELAAMDSEINSVEESIPPLKVNLKSVAKKLDVLRSAPTTKELISRIEQMSKEVKEKADRLKEFKNGSVQMVTKVVMDRVEKDYKYWTTKKMTRKKAFQQLEGLLLDGGIPKDDLWDQAGLEEVEN